MDSSVQKLIICQVLTLLPLLKLLFSDLEMSAIQDKGSRTHSQIDLFFLFLLFGSLPRVLWVFEKLLPGSSC